MLPSIQSQDEIMQILRDEIYAYGDAKLLAIRCGVSTGCILAIRRGKTKWPRWPTFAALMDVLPIRLTLKSYRTAK